MAATKFSDYLGLNHYKKAKKIVAAINLSVWEETGVLDHPKVSLGNAIINNALLLI